MHREEPTSRTCLHRLNTRQRKKLRVGEFQEMAFELEILFKAPQDEAGYDIFIHAFIDLAYDRGLLLGAFGGRLPLAKTDGLVSAHLRSVTEEERTAIIAWMHARDEVASVNAGPLRDGWYGWEF